MKMLLLGAGIIIFIGTILFYWWAIKMWHNS